MSGPGALTTDQLGCWSGGSPYSGFYACISGGGDDGTTVGQTMASCSSGAVVNVIVGNPCTTGGGAS